MTKWKRAELSLTMMRALAAIRQEEGKSGKDYPGRWPTIDALRRRRLVRVVRRHDANPARTDPSAFAIWLTDEGRHVHLHTFKTTMHLDGCHYYSTVATCEECGAAYTHYGERDLKNDPYSLIWMDDHGDPDDPEHEPCPRCQELIAGAKPIFREQIEERRARATA